MGEFLGESLLYNVPIIFLYFKLPCFADYKTGTCVWIPNPMLSLLLKLLRGGNVYALST